ncbi:MULTISPECIES: LpqN/LpqT family lipoprotein [unclassified Nocardioides]|uniref:LpqN/LpqT family lipoprotein n=1 Tax=unclassified Nocardioides TaxID=2615069 RepID=UPI0007028BDB|nr:MULTISPECIES: LpqN/LpqT family lipoprotein [unclassified Nocardioides]KRC53183.1 hypothetical protein ASE19_12470 [Nocardioides sp. Root79]KRC72711.1 hypothetical protein ASE20_08995 [Nocardioides sp. Root240]
MKHPARHLAAPAALLLALVLAACDDEPGARAANVRTSADPTETPGAQTDEPDASGDPTTILEYLQQGGFEQTALGPDDGGPVVALPELDGWSPSDDYASEASYGALVHDAASDATQPPRVLVLLARIDGGADPARILELAPGELLGLDGYTPMDEGESSTLGAYDAVQVFGTYSNGGHELVIAQKTVVIPHGDELHVLQVNAYAPPAEVDVLVTALSEIDATTTITP